MNILLFQCSVYTKHVKRTQITWNIIFLKTGMSTLHNSAANRHRELTKILNIIYVTTCGRLLLVHVISSITPMIL